MRCGTPSASAWPLYLFGQLFRLYYLVAQPSWERVAVIWAPNWVDFFAIGMAMAVYSAAHHAGMKLPSLLRFLGDHPAVSWSVAALVGAELRHLLAAGHARRLRRRVLVPLAPVRGLRVLPAGAGDVR